MSDGKRRLSSYFIPDIILSVPETEKGDAVAPEMIDYDSPLFKINKRYWSYIIYNMSMGGFIEGVSFIEINGLDIPYATQLEECRITPTGIEYLCDNSFMEKAKNFLKDIKEIVPFT